MIIDIRDTYMKLRLRFDIFSEIHQIIMGSRHTVLPKNQTKNDAFRACGHCTPSG